MFTRVQDSAPFEHRSAQSHELASARRTMDEHYVDLLAEVRRVQESDGLWQSANDEWFCGNQELWDGFVEHARSRKCLEIGSGPFGYLSPCNWIADRVVIDPLVDEYRAYQIRLAGRSLFSDDVVTYARPAESLVVELINEVNGFIVCRNALDHLEDPLAVMHNISQYAAAGAYLLLWTDLWHLTGPTEGHRDITRSVEAFDALLTGLGFNLIQVGSPVRDTGDTVELSRLLVKS